MMIERFANPRLARAFSDYLRQQHIAHRLAETAQGSELWLDDPAALARVQQELARFHAEPLHARYLGASWEAPPPAAEVSDLSRRYGGLSALAPARLLRGRGPVTLVVLALCVAVAFWTALGSDRAALQPLLYPATGSEPLWRLLSPIFLHFGIAHLLFNLCWWWLLGATIEREQGSGVLVLVTLGTGLGGNVAQALVSGSGFGGLSGVVFGLIGYLWWYARANPGRGYQLPPALVNFSLLWLVLGYTGVLDVVFGPVANSAHLGGLVAGAVLGALIGRRHRHRQA